jgi:uncharacterized flavoprotein (TIGR03862 family)
MAAEMACIAGARVVVCERMASPGRKFLLAGKGGLNLTHAEPAEHFLARYSKVEMARILSCFDATAIRAWAAGLGVHTIVGSSARVFPADYRAAPLLRRWLARLRVQGVEFRMRHRWLGWDAAGALRFATPSGEIACTARAAVLALGGGSWPELGADGSWVSILESVSVPVTPLAPSNCGFTVVFSQHLVTRWAGAPVKPVLAWCPGHPPLKGECVITAYGLEGGVIYALSACLRETLARTGKATLFLDLVPDRTADALRAALARPRGARSFAEHLRRQLGVAGAKAALLYEGLPGAAREQPATVAAHLKALPLRLQGMRPLAEAISTAGGVDFTGLDAALMLRDRPGIFAAGEMLDWDAPTGGYLLSGCLASGRVAGAAAAAFARNGLPQV